MDNNINGSHVHQEMFECGHLHMVSDKPIHHHKHAHHGHHKVCRCNREDVIIKNKKTFKEIFEPNVISSVELTVISRFKIVINYSDTSVKSTSVDIGDKVAVSFIKNGQIYHDIVCTVTRLIKTEPNVTIELDASSSYESKKFIIPVASIRDISNLSHPENDEYISVGEDKEDSSNEEFDINDIISDIWGEDNTQITDEELTENIIDSIWGE